MGSGREADEAEEQQSWENITPVNHLAVVCYAGTQSVHFENMSCPLSTAVIAASRYDASSVACTASA